MLVVLMETYWFKIIIQIKQRDDFIQIVNPIFLTKKETDPFPESTVPDNVPVDVQGSVVVPCAVCASDIRCLILSYEQPEQIQRRTFVQTDPPRGLVA